MGYSAYKAWTTGTASLNPNTVQLTKVRFHDRFFRSKVLQLIKLVPVARCNALYHSTWVESDLDAFVLRTEKTN